MWIQSLVRRSLSAALVAALLAETLGQIIKQSNLEMDLIRGGALETGILLSSHDDAEIRRWAYAFIQGLLSTQEALRLELASNSPALAKLISACNLRMPHSRETKFLASILSMVG